MRARSYHLIAMEGLLVMADISGYTKFVAGTEAEHSREILAELMDGIAKSFGGLDCGPLYRHVRYKRTCGGAAVA